ncbi:bacterioferritin [Bordetella genomosp. 1]|uniref:Bacterioferritin-associated ferredoxin n=1 Tax=Bordetella genomosp. 1 TaxID=1395607 RepID=A0A261STW1_9BORD|nr:(2Fe-2S)-binding protein [Bordetella genomosp. 1]MDQ8030882.1 (2Fe-2S)-binding protein [Bordetella sp.]OZI40310.1 bacterioferritin [Bordetella genomosp. 1]OZI68505.1 bacterioferritin [Bordetella genomosp. 1]
MYVCICNAVTERQIRACVDSGAATLGDLQFELGVASCCGCCAATATEYLPGGRASSVCDVRSLAVPVNTPSALVDAEPLAAEPAANSPLRPFPVPLVAAA